MRRVSRVLAGVAGALLIAPLAVAAALPASAATGKLLVTTLGHTGIARSSQVIAWNTSQGTVFYGNSGQAFSVPDGQYALVAGIDDNGTAETIAEAIVTVSGTATTKATMDGRQGRLVKVTLDGKPVTDYVDARVCAGPSTIAMADGYQPGGAMYVVPSTSHVFNSSYIAVGQGAVLTGSAVPGVPATLGGAFSTSGLAKVSLTVRSNEQAGYGTQFVLQPQPPSSNGPTCESDLWAPVANNPAPYTASTLVSPGTWNVRTDDYASPGDIGGYFIDRNLAAGHSYAYTYYGAAWAPTGMLPMIWRHSIDLYGPTFADAGGNGNDATTMNSLALSVNGRTVAKGSITNYGNAAPDFAPAISTAGWYTLTDTATRYYPQLAFPATILSPKVTLAWRFYASPTQAQEAAGFWTSFVPKSLSDTNSAAPRSQTTVTVRPYRTSDAPNVSVPSDSVTKVQAWWSGDGVHWNLLAVQHNTSGYYITVPNPASGYVNLRATVTGSHGDTSTETVYKAYAIS
jgi:hypothetical protein